MVVVNQEVEILQTAFVMDVHLLEVVDANYEMMDLVSLKKVRTKRKREGGRNQFFKLILHFLCIFQMKYYISDNIVFLHHINIIV